MSITWSTFPTKAGKLTMCLLTSKSLDSADAISELGYVVKGCYDDSDE